MTAAATRLAGHAARCAIDAITFEGLARQQDWSLARAVYRFEGYNGFSYRRKNINSPYLWSFSNHYTKGKFVRDGVYDPNAVSAVPPSCARRCRTQAT